MGWVCHQTMEEEGLALRKGAVEAEEEQRRCREFAETQRRQEGEQAALAHAQAIEAVEARHLAESQAALKVRLVYV